MAVNSRKHGLHDPKWSNHFSASERGMLRQAIPSRMAEPGQPTRSGFGNSVDNPRERASSIRFSFFSTVVEVSDFTRSLSTNQNPHSEPEPAGTMLSVSKPIAKYAKLVLELHFRSLFSSTQVLGDFFP